MAERYVWKSIFFISSSYIAETFQETQNGVVDLPEDDPGTIRRLIQYLYSGYYNIPKTKKTNEMVHEPRPVANRDGVAFTYHFPHTCNPNDPPIVHVCPHHTCANRCDYRRPGYNKFAANFSCEDCIASKVSLGTEEALIVHAQLYAVADKYAVIGLNKCAAQSFKDACKFFWDSPTFAKVARQVFADTPENDKGLREIVIKTIANHMILNKKPEIKALMLEFSSLCYGVLVETHADKDFFG